jgi:hypothetical protein
LKRAFRLSLPGQARFREKQEQVMRNALKAVVLLAFGLAAFAFVSPHASAASASSGSLTLKGILNVPVTESLVEEARYGRRYRRWRRRCRRRWGYGWRYRRCMRRHGVYRGHRYRRCRRWRRRCRDRWGHGWRYRRCMRNHGCRRFY